MQIKRKHWLALLACCLCLCVVTDLWHWWLDLWENQIDLIAFGVDG